MEDNNLAYLEAIHNFVEVRTYVHTYIYVSSMYVKLSHMCVCMYVCNNVSGMILLSIQEATCMCNKIAA